MRVRSLTWLCGLVALAAPAHADELMDTAKGLFEPIPAEPPAVEGVEATPERVELGKMLYFEPRLSESHTITCNACHVVGLGGFDMLETSLGHRWQKGGRNAPTVLNAVFNTAQFWDGRAKDLEEQAGGPMVNPVEMATTHEHVIEQLSAIPGYVAMFQKAFPEGPDPLNIKNVEDSIALFEATLITPNAPFDQYLRGDDNALTAEQKEGLRLFVDNGCAGCHNGINVGGGMYPPFGVVELPGAEFLPPADKGRFMVTKTPSDEYVFKVPTLRNIALTPPYFHTGKSWDLRQGGGGHGIGPARHSADRRRGRQDHRLSAERDRGAAGGGLPHPAAERGRHAAAATVGQSWRRSSRAAVSPAFRQIGAATAPAGRSRASEQLPDLGAQVQRLPVRRLTGLTSDDRLGRAHRAPAATRAGGRSRSYQAAMLRRSAEGVRPVHLR
jgi:cytochrome c peroxidase